MKREELFFSMRQAIKDPLIRWTVIACFLLVVGFSTFFIWSIYPAVRRTGLVTLHYNTYLGIDDVRTWPWLFTIPGIALFFLIFDTMTSLVIFQKDRLAARALIVFLAVTLLLWAAGVFFLTRINL